MGRARRNSESLGLQGLPKAPHKTCINVHSLQKPCTQTILLCCKSRLLVGQFYFNHQEIQDRKYWAKVWLAEVITQTCRALQLNSHGPLMKSWRIHLLRWLKTRCNVPTSHDSSYLRNFKDNALLPTLLRTLYQASFPKRLYTATWLPPRTPITTEDGAKECAALSSNAPGGSRATQNQKVPCNGRSWMIFWHIYAILWRWTTCKSLPKQEFTYSLTVRHLERRGKGRKGRGKENKNLKET